MASFGQGGAAETIKPLLQPLQDQMTDLKEEISEVKDTLDQSDVRALSMQFAKVQLEMRAESVLMQERLVAHEQLMARKLKEYRQLMAHELKESRQLLVHELKESQQLMVHELKESQQLMVRELKESQNFIAQKFDQMDKEMRALQGDAIRLKQVLCKNTTFSTEKFSQCLSDLNSI